MLYLPSFPLSHRPEDMFQSAYVYSKPTEMCSIKKKCSNPQRLGNAAGLQGSDLHHRAQIYPRKNKPYADFGHFGLLYRNPIYTSLHLY